jgi:SOS response regulatory protein OraA/RecX
MEQMNTTKKAPKKISKAQRIRTLRKEGFKPKQIAAMVGCDIQEIYNLNYLDKNRAARKAIKQKSAMNKHVDNLREEHRAAIEQHVEHLKEAQKVLFAGPEPKLSFMQRVRVLFTGVV